SPSSVIPCAALSFSPHDPLCSLLLPHLRRHPSSTLFPYTTLFRSAALDDANLGRLLGVFEQLRASSQLIVITHQKRTMEIAMSRSEEHTSELQSRFDLVCRLLLEKKKKKHTKNTQR